MSNARFFLMERDHPENFGVVPPGEIEMTPGQMFELSLRSWTKEGALDAIQKLSSTPPETFMKQAAYDGITPEEARGQIITDIIIIAHLKGATDEEINRNGGNNPMTINF